MVDHKLGQERSRLWHLVNILFQQARLVGLRELEDVSIILYRHTSFIYATVRGNRLTNTGDSGRGASPKWTIGTNPYRFDFFEELTWITLLPWPFLVPTKAGGSWFFLLRPSENVCITRGTPTSYVDMMWETKVSSLFRAYEKQKEKLVEKK